MPVTTSPALSPARSAGDQSRTLVIRTPCLVEKYLGELGHQVLNRDPDPFRAPHRQHAEVHSLAGPRQNERRHLAPHLGCIESRLEIEPPRLTQYPNAHRATTRRVAHDPGRAALRSAPVRHRTRRSSRRPVDLPSPQRCRGSPREQLLLPGRRHLPWDCYRPA